MEGEGQDQDRAAFSAHTPCLAPSSLRPTTCHVCVCVCVCVCMWVRIGAKQTDQGECVGKAGLVC
jgi:hypothetical protein